MALEKEARTNIMGSSLDIRNRNWGKVDNHMLETAEDDVHGLASMINKAALGGSGYFKDEKTGFILQWSTVGIGAGLGNATITFPIPFPNALLKGFAMSNYISGDVVSMRTHMTFDEKDNTTAYVYARTPAGDNPATYKQANWFAIGY